jgi:HSP20 family protein
VVPLHTFGCSKKIISHPKNKGGNMNLTIRRPSLLTDFFSDGPFFSNLSDLDMDLVPVTKMPMANVTETNTDFLIELAVPGMNRKDFKVEFDNGVLSISAEKEERKEEKENGRIQRKEYSYESFTRTFQLPENSKSDKIDAKYENGILKVSIPKKEVTVSKPKKEIAVA